VASTAPVRLAGGTAMTRMLTPETWRDVAKELAAERNMSMTVFLALLAEKKDEIGQLV
jgi:hypothetical protein